MAFDIAKEQHKMDEYGTELKAVRDTMQLNPELKKFIHHPLVPPQSKKETLHAIFADDVSPVVLQFLYVMIDRRREAAIIAAIDGFIAFGPCSSEYRSREDPPRKPLSAEEEKQLVASLEKMTGKHIEPLYYMDPSIIGGMIVQIGDRLIDGSLKRQLTDMQHSLLQSDVMNEVTDEK